MKNPFLPSILGIFLFLPAHSHARQNLPPPGEVLTFLKGCGVAEKEAAAFRKLDEDGKTKLGLAVQAGDCKIAKSFKNTRGFIKKFYPPPGKQWDPNFLTGEEKEQVNRVTSAIIETLMSGDIDAFLKSCKIDDADIAAVPELPPRGREKLQEHASVPPEKDPCRALKSFKATRKYYWAHLKPEEATAPVPDIAGFDLDYLTHAEHKNLNRINKKILEILLKKFE